MFDYLLLEKLRPDIMEVRTCDLTHPSGMTWVEWMKEIGFSEVRPSHGGSDFAGKLFDNLPEDQHPEDIGALDDLLRPLVKIVVEMPAPVEGDPMITAVT